MLPLDMVAMLRAAIVHDGRPFVEKDCEVNAVNGKGPALAVGKFAGRCEPVIDASRWIDINLRPHFAEVETLSGGHECCLLWNGQLNTHSAWGRGVCVDL